MRQFIKGIRTKVEEIELNPPLVLLLGFAILILCGGFLLSLPFVTASGQSVGFIDALFTAGSASCVTGLTTVNTAASWNLAGKMIIIILIQIGGLGIMTLATIFPLILRKKIGLTSRQILKEQLNLDSLSGIIKLLKYVLLFTFTVEGIGALFLSLSFIPRFGLAKGIGFSLFHAISAFCNAGFDILGDSIYPLRDDPIVNFTLMALVVIGGLGFFVTQEMIQKKKFNKFSVHSKLVLLISIILVFFGALLFLFLEFTNSGTLASESLGVKVQQSLFQSVISRTAGFYSVKMTELREATKFLLILLMFIGGSPGSTAGGLKTTTFGVLILSMLATIKGENEPLVFRKHISDRTIRKASALVIVSLLLVIIVSFLLTITEEAGFLDLLFETTSAYATVGLTTGVTEGLSDFGKLLITLTMYLGRVGPLSLGYAISNRMKYTGLRYPEANISVG